jgi:geranylgeranyl pyrophosphate synthase
MAITNTNKNHFLERFESQMTEILSWDEKASFSPEPVLFAAARHLCLAQGGKRARPKLVYFFSKGLDIHAPQVIDIAITAEFIHNASLLHDDVIDNGTLRRGIPTANVVWDNVTAVLAGDILLSESIRILTDCPRVVATEALELVSIMTKATMLETHVRQKTDVSLEQWEYIALGKTSSMFRWCGRAIGFLAEDLEAVECFGEFGQHFGIAFQLADDVLDIQHDDSGKTPFADIRNKNPNYPIILSCIRYPEFRKKLEKAWAMDEIPEDIIQELGSDILHSPVLQECIDRIQQEVTLSIQLLGKYTERPGCREIAQWALSMCSRFQKIEAV